MELKITHKELKHFYRIIEIQVFYHKRNGKMIACKPTIEYKREVFDSFDKAENYLIEHYGWNSWVKVNETSDSYSSKPYYEIINGYSCILRYKNSNNYRICSYSIVDYYEDILE